MNAHFDGYPSLAVAPTVDQFTLNGFQSWSRLGNGCSCDSVPTSVITTPGATWRNVPRPVHR